METNKTPTNPENIYKIKYVKTSESFILTVPDPLDPTNAINATATDYELVCLIRGLDPDVDDDLRIGFHLLSKTHRVTERTLVLAKRKAHLRRLSRTDTAWVEIPKRKRSPRKPTDPERVEYLRENFDVIAANCAKHKWLAEYKALCRDVGKKFDKAEWEELKKQAE
jgi:hypothetical protein